jgi:hypothetical protein
MDFNQFVSLRLESLRDRPRMWGSSNETIEALAIQLIEVEVRHCRPEALDLKPRFIMDAYTKELSRLYGTGVLPLYARTPEHLFEYEPKVLDFDQTLYRICQTVRASVRAEISLEPPFKILEIHRLEQNLHLRFPSAKFTLTQPLRSEDTWTLDVTTETRWLVLTWRFPSRFSLSKVTSETVYGDGPDHLFASSEETLKRAIELLSD